MNVLVALCAFAWAVWATVTKGKSKIAATKMIRELHEANVALKKQAQAERETIIAMSEASQEAARTSAALNDEFAKYKIENEKFQPWIQRLKTLEAVDNEARESKSRLAAAERELHLLMSRLGEIREHKNLRESGFFSFKFNFEDVLQYKEALQVLKALQKKMLSSGEALGCSNEKLRDSEIIECLTKIALVAFNNEFELICDRISSTNFDACKVELQEHFDFLNEMLSVFNCSISKDYLSLKVKELAIALEYELQLERMRAEQAALREQMRDEEKAREEAEAAREKAIEEEEKYQQLLDKAKKDAESASAEKQADLAKKIFELENKLSAAQSERERATSNAEVTRRGHVYIISNVGSFGEDVFKIGLTRREDPMERVAELGSASVPFTFDVHAFVKSEDAPLLERALHNKLDGYRINKVNKHKEFFRVSLKQIEESCKEIGCEVQLTYLAEARDFRQSLELLKNKAS